MINQKRTKKFVFGNEHFGGSYTPGEFEINFPEDISRQDFEKIFTSKIEALHKKGSDFAEEIFDQKVKKENLKPLSIRVKSHTKEFFKNHSILSPRDVLELYENFNNCSEAFINSLIEEEKQLKEDLVDIQEKLHNAKLFKEKLAEIDPEKDVLTDEGKIAKIQNIYENTEIKVIGNETPINKAKNNIIEDIQIYNTLEVQVYGLEYLIITVYTNAKPIAYYFKNEYEQNNILEILDAIEDFCGEKEIGFKKTEV